MSSDMLVYETENSELRILLTSDVHYTYLLEDFGVTGEDRMQHWVDAIKEEHKQNPFDLIILVGDYSLDHWGNGGTVIEDNISTTKMFVENYVSQLPKNVPAYILPGNHEQFSDEQWFEMTGNHRKGTILLGNTLFICLDSYGDNLSPTTNTDGTYTYIDVNYIKKMMDEYPDKDVYIVSHFIWAEGESDELKTLVATEDRIKGMFMGHTHMADVMKLNQDWGEKNIAQTGNFSYGFSENVYDTFWGFRELVIKSNIAYSQYISVESDAVIGNRSVHLNRKTSNAVVFYGGDPGNL